MAADVFNIARGMVRYYCSLPAANDALVVVLFKYAGQTSDAAMRDFTTLAAIKASNSEADFTGYTPRKTITSNIVSPGQASIVPDNTNDLLAIDVADMTWSPAGGATNNELGRLVLGYWPDVSVVNDALIVPLTFHDYRTMTDGTPRDARVNVAGFWQSKRPA